MIIVNYNVKYFLEQCLYSVQKACRNIDAEVIVVDNDSTDGSRLLLEPRFPAVKFIWNSSNAGFARANNQALLIASGDYVLFLNPDTIVPEDCFEKCIGFFKTNSDAGALGIRMIDGAGNFLKESKRSFPSPLTSLYKLSGLAMLFPRSRSFAKYYLGNLSENENHEVDVLAGAFMMIPRTVLATIGGFDEIFFMYGEDVDLSYRIQKTGLKNFYFSGSSIIHFKGESTKKGSLNYIRLFYRAMSLFVIKHYSGSRAGFYNFLIQVAILLRAFLTITGKALQRIGLPLLDAGIILMSFWAVKYFWNTFIRKDVNYFPNVLMIAFPVFTVIFLISSYYAGLYDKGYRQKQLYRSTITASLILLSGYALLPENLRFSRGIMVFGIVFAFVLMNIIRRLFIHWRLLETGNEADEHRQTIIVANEKDFVTVTSLMQRSGMRERVLGRVYNGADPATNSLGGIEQLPGLLKKYPVKELIFCEDGLSYAAIISIIGKLPRGIRNKFHSSGSSSIVGSDSKDVTGEYVTAYRKYRIDKPGSRRKKNLLDVTVAVIFILSFPFHLVLQKRPASFFNNVMAVLLRKKTWVGYASLPNDFPHIKKGIITSASLPSVLIELPREILNKGDEWYAREYSVLTDLQKIWKGYRYLYL